MAIMKENENALEQYMSSLWDAIKADDGDAHNAQWIKQDVARDGNAIDVLMVDGKEYTLQSRYKPIEEAKKYTKQYEGIKPGSCVLFLGFGNGYVVRELLNYPEVSYVFYEPSKEYFQYVLKNYDISDIVANNRVYIYVEGLNAHLLPHDMYIYVHSLNWNVFYLDALPKYQQLYPQSMTQLSEIYEESKLHGMQNYDVDIRFASQHLYNAIHNLEYVYSSCALKEYEGILRPDIPVIVVAAGPSLEKNVELLKKYKQQAFILCIDRAAPYLAKVGILPHAYVTVDAAKELYLFEDEQSGNAPWFAYTTSNYDALKKLNNPEIIFCSTIYQYAESLFQKVGSDIYPLINGGSVATVAVNIAMKLGSNRIVLIGQDLALSGNKTYAGDTVGEIEEASADKIMVPAYDGGMVETRPDFKSYIDWYESFVAKYEDITFVNATEGGAYLTGMEHISLQEAMDKYGATSFDGDACMQAVRGNLTSERKTIIEQEYKEMMRYFKNVKREVVDAVTCMERGIYILKQQGLGSKELDKVEKQMNRFQNIYNGHEAKSILDLNIAKEIQEALIDVHFTNDDVTLELIRLYEKMLNFYHGVERTVKEAIPMLEDVLNRLHI